MNYYTKPKHQRKKYKSILAIIITIFIIFNLVLVLFDRKVMPSVMEIAETKMKNSAIKIISETSIEVFEEEFSKADIVQIGRDKNGKINSIESNTMQLNKLSGEIATRSNKKLIELGDEGIEVPLGWMTDKSVYYNLGPVITIEMEPLGSIETSYNSVFESAGINQTRHSIYLTVNAKLKVIIPMYSEEIEVNTKIPLSETIIVGEIPDTSIDLKK